TQTETYYARTIFESPQDTSIEFGISFSSPIQVKINDKEHFVEQKKTNFYFKEIAYSMFLFQDTIKVDIKQGQNSIVIGLSNYGRNYFYLRQITSPEEKPIIEFNNKWLLKSNDEWIEQKPVKYEKLVIGKENTYQRESYIEWHYAIGGTMLGLHNLYKFTGDRKYYDCIKKFCDFTIANRNTFKSNYYNLHALRVANYRMFRKTMLDDTGAPTLPLTKIYQEINYEDYLPIIKEMGAYVTKEQARLKDQTFCRPEPFANTVWADDLFMSVPFLLMLHKITREDKYLNDAITQIINFHSYLWNEDVQLNKHAWFYEGKQQSLVYWIRANGWMIWAISEALLIIPPDHPKYDRIKDIYKISVDGLVQYQAPNGLWHQVLDKTESFQETSGSAMFTLAIARGVNNGWLEDEYSQYVSKAWEGLSANISVKGVVKDICRGTGIGFDYDFYFNRKRFDNDPRGLGAVLTALVEIQKMMDSKY
ncbi:MAG: glycoside hydrolase family 88 protein, partial [Ignavibacterium sp.]